jgi:hypothetical protein
MSLYHQQVKVVGVNGQVSLGKEFAGKTVLIDQIDETTWVIKSGIFVPDSEKWLYQGKNLAKLEKALEWVEKNASKDNFDELAKGSKDE